MRNVGSDSPGAARPQRAPLVTDPEIHLTGDHHPVLLAGMPVLGNHGQRVQLDDGKGDKVALNSAHPNARKDLDRWNLLEIGEIGHDVVLHAGTSVR